MPIEYLRKLGSYFNDVGLGFINFACTIPVFFFIDGRGRRPLLLLSLVGMTITLFGASLSFLAPNQVVRAVLVAVFSIGLFTPFYSVGVGPVPYTYSAEIFPLAFRGKFFRHMLHSYSVVV